MKNKIYSLIVFIVFISSSVLSQDDSTKSNYDEDDEILISCCSKYYHSDEDDNEFDIDFLSSKNKPAISFNYGFTNLKRKDINSKNLIDPVAFELKLGTIKQKNIYGKEDLLKEKYNYFLISNYSSYIKNKNSNLSDINTDTWKLGFGSQTGYGYKFSQSFAIVPYTEGSFNWSRINFAYDTNFVTAYDRKIIDLYDESFRLGTSSAGGVKFKMFDNLVLDFSYERQLVFQRVLFWKMAGSYIIEAASQGLLDNFIYKIFESSPYAAPIVSFILKNALSYGFYELRQEKMNWPFKSESSLSFDLFKFGITFIF